MKMLNPAPDVDAGWLARGMCHALEVGYIRRRSLALDLRILGMTPAAVWRRRATADRSLTGGGAEIRLDQ